MTNGEVDDIRRKKWLPLYPRSSFKALDSVCGAGLELEEIGVCEDRGCGTWGTDSLDVAVRILEVVLGGWRGVAEGERRERRARVKITVGASSTIKRMRLPDRFE